MCVYSNFVKSDLHHHDGRAPKRSFVTQAFTAACLLRDHLLEIETATQAAIACGVAPSYVAAATIILNAGNDTLTKNVLDGYLPLLQTAERVQKRAALIAAFRNASPADRRALGLTIGANEIFDDVVAPTLVEVACSL